MIQKILRSNALVLSYEALSSEGKVLRKSQSFKFIADDSDDDDIFEVGSSIGSILAYAPKELRHDLSYFLLEG